MHQPLFPLLHREIFYAWLHNNRGWRARPIRYFNSTNTKCAHWHVQYSPYNLDLFQQSVYSYSETSYCTPLYCTVCNLYVAGEWTWCWNMYAVTISKCISVYRLSINRLSCSEDASNTWLYIVDPFMAYPLVCRYLYWNTCHMYSMYIVHCSFVHNDYIYMLHVYI